MRTTVADPRTWSRLAALAGIACATGGLAAGSAHGAGGPFDAAPAGTAVAYTNFEDEARCHQTVKATGPDGAALALLSNEPVAALVTDELGTLWAATGCTSGRGIPMPPCALWRAGDTTPRLTASAVKKRLVARRLTKKSVRSSGLLCDIHPALGGGLTAEWNNIRIRISPTGSVTSARRVARPLSWPVRQTSDGRLITAARKDGDGTVLSSNVAGRGVFPGEVLDVFSDGRQLTLIEGDLFGDGASEAVALVQPTGPRATVWSTTERITEVREAQFSSDGQSAFVRAGTTCMFCEGTIYRVNLAAPEGAGQAIIPNAGVFRVVR